MPRPPLTFTQVGRGRSAVETLGVESLVLNTGRRSSPVVTRGVESLKPAGRDAHEGRLNCEAVSSGPAGWLLRYEIFISVMAVQGIRGRPPRCSQRLAGCARRHSAKAPRDQSGALFQTRNPSRLSWIGMFLKDLETRSTSSINALLSP